MLQDLVVNVIVDILLTKVVVLHVTVNVLNVILKDVLNVQKIEKVLDVTVPKDMKKIQNRENVT